MREFKFRAWGHYPHGNKKRQDCMEEDWQELDYIEYVGFDGGGYFEIMQFTRLKDKNDKEIYEGDIVKEYPGFGCEWEARVGIVKYSGASFWLDFKRWSHILDDHDCRLEVVGNIYENPELLEKIK